VELRRYLEVSRRWWWLVGLALLAAAAVTVASVASQTPTYQSSASFLVRPRSGDASEDARAFDALIRGVTINTTYASIARSELIRDRAEERMDPEARADEMSVSAKVLTDTNIVSLSVKGPDADHVLALTTAISAEAVEYVNALSDVYVLQPLEEPTRADGPIATNRTLTMLIGVVLGLGLGVGLALLVEYLRTGPATLRSGATTHLGEAPSPRDASGTAPTESRAPRWGNASDPVRDDRVGVRGPSPAGPADSADRSNGDPDRPD
jgi:capsular polysaccharide biosynthesis protein